MKNIILLLIISTILFSCSNFKHKKEIRIIDSLYCVLDSTEMKMNEIDLDELRSMKSTYMGTIEDFRSCSANKDLDSVWAIVTGFSTIKSYLKKYINEHNNVEAELKFSRNQLKDLKNSLKNNKIPEDSINNYIQLETSSVDVFNKKVIHLIDFTKQGIELYDSLNPQMIEVIEELKKH